jgi:hypothetical protein
MTNTAATTVDDEPVEAEDAPPAWETRRVAGPWAIVEIFGHTVRAGTISDAQLGGATMLRIQHPTVPDHDRHGPLSELYGDKALFCVRPCSRADAIRFAEARWRAPAPVPAVAELAAIGDAPIDVDEPWDDDNYTDDDQDDDDMGPNPANDHPQGDR